MATFTAAGGNIDGSGRRVRVKSVAFYYAQLFCGDERASCPAAKWRLNHFEADRRLGDRQLPCVISLQHRRTW